MDEVRAWMESLGWKAVEVDGKVTGYRYGERTLIKPDVAENWYAIREQCPFGPPRF